MTNHVYGNTKISILKNIKKTIEFVIRFFLSFFYKFKDHQKIIISSAVYAPWLDDKDFSKIYDKVNSLTLLDEPRAYTLWYFSKFLRNVDGDIYDIGSMKGGAGIIMSKANQNIKTKTFFIDTFDGFAITSGQHKKNEIFNYNKIDELNNNLENFNIQKFAIVKTRFPNNFKIKKKIKLCHLDINIFKDTVKSFMFLDKFMAVNGVIVFDDYGIFKVDDILHSVKKILSKKYDKKYSIIYNYMGQCIMIKKK